jgi:hypothetical protein
MKKQTATDNRKDKAQAIVLANNEKLICANLIRIIIRKHLIKIVDSNAGHIEHDKDKVTECVTNP